MPAYNSAIIKQKLDDAISCVLSEHKNYVLNPGKDFTRNRILTLERMIKIILGMGGQSLNRELDAYSYKYGFTEDEPIRKSAFVQQRAKIKPELFLALMHVFNSITDSGKDLYKGYKLFAVDGSDLKVYRNKESASYIESNGRKGYNLLHINAIFNLLTHRYEDSTIVPKNECNERSELISMLKNLASAYKILIIADRGYASLNLYEHIHRTKNVEYLIRVKNDQFKELEALPYEEFDKEIVLHIRTGQTKHDRELYKKGEAHYLNPYRHHRGKTSERIWDFEDELTMTLRVIRIKINDTGDDHKDYETIITSLDRFTFPLKEIKKLYGMRWGEETSFRYLKYSLGLVNIHSKSEEHIKQEIFAKLVMYNFCALITYAVIIYQNKGNKWVYAINFDMGIAICLDYFRYRGKSPPVVENRISEYTEPVRPGRADERKLSNKPVVWFGYRVA